MGREMTKRNIQTELHRFERLKTDTYKVNRHTDILHSCMYTCTQTKTHKHTHIRPGGSVVCVQLGSLRLPDYFCRQNALTEPFDR